jgi:GT2 family glycosyltransferase
MSELSIAVVLTCFNRKDKTEACLDALFAAEQRLVDGVRLHVIVTDDGSKDGTGEMLHNRFPRVEVLHGDGGLFWNGGMRLAFGQALAQGHDFYLWINDDTILYPECLESLLATHAEMVAQTGRGGLVVGSTCNDEGKVSYGGLRRKAGGKLLQFCLVEPAAQPQSCESSNGNCLLVSKEAARQLGNLDAAYVHSMGDMDYGLRATNAGIPLWVMPGFVGRCGNDHPLGGSYLDQSLPFAVRWKKALSPKELSPRAWGVFCRRHAGPWWPVYWAWPYAKIVLTSLKLGRTSSDRT